jgi:hypothetical protein
LGGQRHVLLPGKRLGTHYIDGQMGPRDLVEGSGKFRPTGIRSPGRPARSESLYRLHYPVPLYIYIYICVCVCV